MPLEDRITPTQGFLGPLTEEQHDAIISLGLNAYSSLATIPASPTGAVSYFDLENPRAFRIDSARIKNRLASSPVVDLAIPTPNGGFERFRVFENHLLTPDFAAARPDIKTYRGVGIDDPNATLVADITPLGFRAQVLSPNGVYYIDPYYHLETSVFVSYFKQDNLTDIGHVVVPDQVVAIDNGGPILFGPSPVIALGANLRTFRLALAATAEYTSFYGGSVSNAQAGMVTSVNRVSGVYEKDIAVSLSLINNTSLIYTNASTDPYTNDDGVAMLAENQSNITSVIGSANYDIGHVFSTGGGGVAGLGVVGNTSNKARGVTGSGSPTGDNFDIDYVAHEMGHQFAGNHSFNTSQNGNRNGTTAWEPGSGSTIMSYAGIIGGGDDLQGHSDAYFYVGNIGEIRTFLNSITAVGTTTASGNSLPVANAGPNYTIPASTPFALTGSATGNIDGGPLTYTWEQYDLGAANTLSTISAGNTTAGPVMRSLTGTSNPTRTIPRLSNLLANNTLLGEYVSNVARTLNFTLTVKDTFAMTGPIGGVIGGISSDDMVVTVAASAAFTVIAPNTAVSWQGGTSQTVTWNVGSTNAAPINTSNVNILLSTDGGNTFPITVLANTPNDGSETITVPNNVTSQARIKVQPVGNIYFDVSNTNFTITPGSAMQVTGTTPSLGGLITGPTATFDVNFSQPINVSTLAVSDLAVSVGSVTGVTIPAGLPNTARFTIDGLTAETPITASIAAGSITSTLGNGTGAFSGNYSVDFGISPFPMLAGLQPAGSRVYNGSQSATINVAGDTDSFTLDLDAGQTLSAVVMPSSGLMPQVTIIGPGTNVSANASAAGKPAIINSATILQAGLYTVSVTGYSGTSGAYSLEVTANGATETESVTGIANSTSATAQNIDTSFLPLGGGAALSSVYGRFDGAASSTESEPNNSTNDATNVTSTFGTYSGNLYALGITGALSSTTDQDYYNIGTLQAGDVISITESGAFSSGGTLPDPYVYLYRAGASAILVSDDDGGAGGTGTDSLIYRYTVTIPDTYYIRAEVYNNSGSGTYRLGVLLENSGAAPATGGSVFTESGASNDTKATGQNVSSSWRAPSHFASATGTLTASDVDFFAYTFAAGDLITVNARSTLVVDTRVTLRASNGTVLALEDGGSNNNGGPGLDSPIYAYRITTAGTYFLEVGSVGGEGSYALDVYLTTTTPPPPPVDLFAMTLTAGQNVSLNLKGQTVGTNVLDLVDAAGNVLTPSLGNATNVDRVVTNYNVPVTGVYYARVSSNVTADYVLTTAINTTLDIEANDTFSTAQPVGTNSRISGSISSGNADWYRIDLPADVAFTVSTGTPFDGTGLPTNTLDPRIEIYSPGNVFLAGNSNGAADSRNAIASIITSVAGSYYFFISDDSFTSGEYFMSMAVTPNPNNSVIGFSINTGQGQRSRLQTLTVTFANPVNPAFFNNAGDITLTRYASTISGVNGTVVQTGAVGANGLITVTQPGPANTLTLTFSNADGSSVTQGVEYDSLADGRWRLALPVFSYENPIGAGDPIIRRLFGDVDGNGLVDGNDFGFFPPFGTAADNPFDFNDNNDVDSATDFTQFGNRFGVTL